MNSDSESLQYQLLTWLLSDDNKSNEQNSVQREEINQPQNPLKAAATPLDGDLESVWTPQTFQLGDIPTVQERFQAVLKSRLKTKIEQQPPLFPWESQIREYPDYVDNPSLTFVPGLVWAAQATRLNLPVSLPDKVFQQLLSKCQALVASPLPLGAKLVQAVESLFPDDSQSLNDLAGLVLRSPYRSGTSVEMMPNLDNNYSELQPPQQMALSLLAAKQLLEDLVLPISADNPVVERQWLTSAGAVTLKVEYQSTGELMQLRVEGNLPTPGSLQLQGNGSQAACESTTAGSLSVELSSNQFNQHYSLAVKLTETDQQPLVFAIVPTM
ncbi:MAG: PatU [Nostocaceae cyanobacterium]|nr:PatU [Nostocaceae cyanobacterium]